MQKNKKKIAVFIDWYTPGYKAGGPITSVKNIIDNLKDEFDFYVITSDRDYLDETPYQNIQFDKWLKIDHNVNIIYISKENLSKNTLSSIINSSDFDTVYINGIYSYFYSILPLLLSKKEGKKVIVSARGMLSEHAFSRKSLKKKVFLIMAKIRGYYKGIKFHATNETEKKDIFSITKNKNIEVIPNLPRKLELKQPEKKEKTEDELNLVSIARISQEKNTRFALELLSKIKEGKITFDLYGSINDEDYWKECQEIISSMPKNIKVNYKETVKSEKVIETFSKYHFSFMPSLGENFGHSMLESMASGTPVIISDQTPWKNLEEKGVGWDIPLDKPEKFADAINKCLKMNKEQYQQMSLKVYKFAIDYIKEQNLVEKTKSLFND